nr:ras-related protein Rab-3-like [Cherax quadricarinatus]
MPQCLQIASALMHSINFPTLTPKECLQIASALMHSINFPTLTPKETILTKVLFTECNQCVVPQDTAGQERYRTITTAYYRGAMGFILMYDITNEESFNSVQDWCTQIKTYSWDNAQVILVGNKCDMEDERVISYERGKQLADQLGLEFYETSAKENINVKAVFERLVDIICDKMSESLDTDPNLVNASKSTRLTDNPQPQNGSCQC